MDKEYEGTVCKIGNPIANSLMKRWSNSFVLKEMQIK